jgi:hypothetical protein
MDHDGVAEAFDLILDEITIVENQLSGEGATAIKEKRFQEAKTVIEAGERLLAFRSKLEGLKREWGTIDLKTRRRIKVVPGYGGAPGSKAPRTRLRVSLSNGKVVDRRTGADTFADVVEWFGLEAVRALNRKVNGIPLVGDKPHSKYNQLRRGKFLIVTHSSTKSKKEILEQMAAALGKRITVEIVG